MNNKFQYSFDIYEKYSTVADIINKIKPDNRKFTVLEIGGRGEILEKFLPDAEIFILDNELVSTNPNFILGDATNLSFPDNYFDFIVSCDVLEHIPFDKREAFIKEHYRCAKITAIFIAPFSSENNDYLETDIIEKYKKLSNGEDYRWLLEHKENGLPEVETIIKILNDNSIVYEYIPLGDSTLWHFMLNLSHLVVYFNWQYEDIYQKFNQLNEFFNKNISVKNKGDSSTSPYRYVFMMYKNIAHSAIISPVNNRNNEELFSELSKKVWEIIVDIIVKKNSEISQFKKGDADKEKKLLEATMKNMDLEVQIEVLKTEISNKDNSLKVMEEQQQDLLQNISLLNNSIEKMQDEIDNYKKENKVLKYHLEEKNHDIGNLYNLIHVYENSTSWKLTKPFRSSVRALKSIPKYTKKLGKKSISFKNYLLAKKVFNLKTLLNKEFLDNYKTYSFDMFDTLVFRKIDPPEYIHQSTAHYIRELLIEEKISGITIEKIVQTRYEKEWMLRNQCFNAGKDYECELYDIIFETLTELNDAHFATKYSKTVMDYEVASEKKVLYANPEALDTLKTLKENNKRVIVVSDMYLSKEDLIEILESCNLMHYIDEVYVSSVYGFSKGTGRLFSTLIQEEIIQPKETIHVGDNYISDYKMPQKELIRSLWYYSRGNNKRRKKLRDMIEAGDALKIVREIIGNEGGENDKDIFYKLGKEILGPIFVLYIQNVINVVREKNINEIFFLAREGYLFKKIYNELIKSKKYMDSTLPDGKYTYISRLSSSLPSAYSLGFREVRMGLWKINQKGLYSILTTFNLEPDKFKIFAEDHGIYDMKQPIFDPYNDIRLHNFLTDFRVQKLIYEQIESERNLLSRYFNQLGFFGIGKKCAFVDIGWSGTIQHNIGRAFIDKNDFPELYGLYFGRNTDYHLRYLMHPKIIFEPGFVFDFESYNNNFTRAIMDFPQLFEQAATAPHASTIGYKEENGVVVPTLKTTSSEDRKQELNQFELIDQIQQGIMSFAKSYTEVTSYVSINIENAKIHEVKKLNEFIVNPKMEYVNALEKLYHSEDWGTQNILKIISPSVSKKSILKPRRLLKELRESFWKQGTLKKVNLPFLVYLYNTVRNYKKSK